MKGESKLILVSEENLLELAYQIANRIIKEKYYSKWVPPEEAENLLNLKRQTILRLYENGDIHLTWPGMEGSKVWMANRESIEKYLEKKRNYNLKK